MTTVGKVALIVAGYVVAFLVAAGAVWLHQLATARDSVGSDGMYAFGEALLFLFVFGVLALVPTAAGVYFLRRNRSLWGTVSMLAVIIALTAPLALALYVASYSSLFAGLPALLTVAAVVRLFASSVLFAAFAVFGVLARNTQRKRFLIASVLEALACLGFIAVWFASRR